MDKIFVNTDSVKNVAQKVAYNNTIIQNKFNIVASAMEQLNYNWHGNAAENAQSRYRVIRKVYYDDTTQSRYLVIDNYVKMLNDVVAKGYEETESINTKIADAFK